MSYDIFVSGLNIAVEYQGKQHFEPVDFSAERKLLKIFKKETERSWS